METCLVIRVVVSRLTSTGRCVLAHRRLSYATMWLATCASWTSETCRSRGRTSWQGSAKNDVDRTQACACNLDKLVTQLSDWATTPNYKRRNNFDFSLPFYKINESTWSMYSKDVIENKTICDSENMFFIKIKRCEENSMSFRSGAYKSSICLCIIFDMPI